MGSAIESQILSVTGVGNGPTYEFPDVINTSGYTDAYVYCSNSLDDPGQLEFELNQ